MKINVFISICEIWALRITRIIVANVICTSSFGSIWEFLFSFSVLQVVEKIRDRVVEKLSKYVVAPIISYLLAPIGRPLGCLFCYNGNIEDLRTKLEKLRDIRDEVQGLVVAAEGNGEVALPRVQRWLESAKETLEDRMNLLDKKLYLNLKVRYQRSRIATEKTSAVEELIQKSRSIDRVSIFGSRMSIFRDIMEALKDNQINRIGICGWTGVGKTYLLKDVVEEVKDRNLFEEIAMVTVSSDPKRIQCEIADMLGLRFDENNDAGRALFQRLEGKKRILIILDDISKKVDLKAIGIPYDGCKIVLVSQGQDVCHQSGAEKYFPIEALSEDEGWKLFRRTVSDSVDSQDLYPKPAEVAKRCAGSPMLIVEAARAFKKRGKWSEVSGIGVIDGRDTIADSLSQLKTFDLDKPLVDEAKSSPRPSVDQAKRSNRRVAIGGIGVTDTIKRGFLKTFAVDKPSVDEAKSSPRPSVDKAKCSNSSLRVIQGRNTIATASPN